MKKLIPLMALLLLCNSVFAAKVPLEAFAQKSKIKSSSISPDGKFLAYTFEDTDRVKLGVMELKTKKGIYAFDVGKDREVIQFDWVNNERLFFLGGNITGWLDGAKKDYRAYFANYDGKKREALPVQYSRIVSMLDDDPNHVLIAKSFRDGIKIHKMNVNSIKTSYQNVEPKAIGTMNSTVRGISFDHNDRARFAYEFDPKKVDDFDDDVLYIHHKTAEGEWKNLKVNNQRKKMPLFGPLGFNKNNDKFYFTSNYDLPGNGANGLFEFDFNTNEINLLYRHEDADILGGIYNSDDVLIGAQYEAGYRQYYYLEDESVKKDVAFHKSVRATFPDSIVSIGDFTKDKSTTTLHVRSDRNPGEFYIYDVNNQKINFLTSSMPQIDPKTMAKVEPFTMHARDGLKMYGQMTIPNDKELKNLPMVIYPHGGPYGPRDLWSWDARAQLFANNGYLVLQLNFRGSGGYGQGFEEAGHHEWGAKMQDDITDATLWAIEQGYADKNRVCIHGVSYGGYASMQAVVKEPDLYKCSIPDAGPYDLDYQLRKADSFKQNGKARKWFFKQMLGENYENLNKERSPAFHIDKLKAKLLIVHGTKDVRVPVGNAYLLEEKLKEKGVKYETMYKKDGHGFQKIPNRIELYKKMLKFLKKHIGE